MRRGDYTLLGRSDSPDRDSGAAFSVTFQDQGGQRTKQTE